MNETIRSKDSLAEKTGNEGELDLFAGLLFVVQRWRFVAVWGLLGLTIGIAAGFLLKAKYTTQASIVIPQVSPGASTAAIAAELAGGLDLAAGSGAVYIDMMHSRRLMDRLIEKEHLASVFKTNDRDQLREILTGMTKFESLREGLVTVTVTAPSRELAAALADGYVDELQALDRELAIGSATSRRQYFERALFDEKDALAEAEVKLREVTEKTRGVSPTEQSTMEMRAIEVVREQLSQRQAQLAVLQQSATAANPQVQRLQSEIHDLENQLIQMEAGESANGLLGTSKLPEAEQEYLRALRAVKYHEQLFEALSKQVDKARLDESNSVPSVQILDRGEEPLRKSWPPRKLLAVLGLATGIFLAVVWIFLRQFIRLGLGNAYSRRYGDLVQAAQRRG